MLHVLTFQPEFAPPWPTRSHLTPITLNRLERPQVETLVQRLAGGKRLPAEVVQHIVAKTDGVPLYVEELTKMLLTSHLLREEAEQYVLTGPLLTVAIPDTLQDSLMARLDQMNTAKEARALAQTLAHPATQALALFGTARLRQLRRDVPEAHELAEATITISAEHGNAYQLAQGTVLHG
jgi:predicted ATPase